MNYSPTPQKRRAGTVSAVLLAVAAVSYIFSAVETIPPLPLQIVCMGCLCAATYIMVRYIYTGMTYIIRPKDCGTDDVRLLPREAVDLCVMKNQGRRASVTECLLSLDKLVRIDTFTDSYLSRIREEYKDVKIYHYTVSMFPEKRQALIFDDGGDVYCIVIEADAAFLSLLQSIAPDASANI